MNENPVTSSAYDFSFTDLKTGAPISLREFQGKVMLIVNTASMCGFTPQYEGLEKLYQQYKAQGLVIIGVPSNDFGKQEPGDATNIQQFCDLNFHITFPMMNKEIVKGKAAHPFYQWAHKTLGFGSAPKWNFHKYLIDRNGKLVNYFYTFRRPDSKVIQQAVKALLHNQ